VASFSGLRSAGCKGGHSLEIVLRAWTSNYGSQSELGVTTSPLAIRELLSDSTFMAIRQKRVLAIIIIFYYITHYSYN